MGAHKGRCANTVVVWKIKQLLGNVVEMRPGVTGVLWKGNTVYSAVLYSERYTVACPVSVMKRYRVYTDLSL